MERETKIIVTPIGKQEVELNTYVTGREKRALTNIFLSGNLSFNVEDKDVKGINANVIEEAENLALRTVIVSIDKTKEDIVKRVLDMHAKDYAFVVLEVNNVTSDKDFTEKKIV